MDEVDVGCMLHFADVDVAQHCNQSSIARSTDDSHRWPVLLEARLCTTMEGNAFVSLPPLIAIDSSLQSRGLLFWGWTIQLCLRGAADVLNMKQVETPYDIPSPFDRPCFFLAGLLANHISLQSTWLPDSAVDLACFLDPGAMPIAPYCLDVRSTYKVALKLCNANPWWASPLQSTGCSFVVVFVFFLFFVFFRRVPWVHLTHQPPLPESPSPGVLEPRQAGWLKNEARYRQLRDSLAHCAVEFRHLDLKDLPLAGERGSGQAEPSENGAGLFFLVLLPEAQGTPLLDCK